jgi:tetratricopeptide (TPR) repeat protein
MKKIIYVSMLSMLFLCVSYTALSKDSSAPKNIKKRRLDLVKIINNRTECDELLAKMKKDILDKLNGKLESNPKDIWALIQKGWTLNSEGKYDKAIEYFMKALKIKEASSAYMGLGMAYIRKGDLQNADKCYMKALEQKESGDPYYIGDTKISSASISLNDKGIE